MLIQVFRTCLKHICSCLTDLFGLQFREKHLIVSKLEAISIVIDPQTVISIEKWHKLFF